ncbi:MAG: sodium-dependent transporter [Kiritimatiellae bacterium]|nr:sodium-dependent transporter [Kiritimatiellia bacterium]
MQNKRETLGSRLGFILISAGCAIGIGNVWRFPWLAGRYGGGWFVVAYLAFLVLLGLPVMTMEFAMGRAAGRSPALIYQSLGRPGWRWHGAASFAGCVLLMSYYTTVAGWMFTYFALSVRGSFAGMDSAAVGAKFGTVLADPAMQLVPMALVVAAGFAVCAAGLRGGLERVTKWMMLALLALMAVLAAHSVLLERTSAAVAEDGSVAVRGAMDGVRYFLVPDSSSVAAHGGWPKVVAEAMNQAFFTLSLGIGAMAIFGSYIGRDRALLGESVRVTVFDTIVALCAGLIVIPACFAYGVEPGAGPGLLFATLPNVFAGMSAGRLWGSLFFVFMSFAAFSTVLAVFENILACAMDWTGWSRRRASAVCASGVFALSVPCALGWSVLAGFHPLGADSGVLDLEDFVVSNLLLPGGAFVYVLFCTRRFGWGWEGFASEANAGRGAKVKRWMRFYCTWILPVVVLAILGIGLRDAIG